VAFAGRELNPLERNERFQVIAILLSRTSPGASEADAKIPLDERGGRGLVSLLWRFHPGRWVVWVLIARGGGRRKCRAGAITLWRGAVGRVAGILWVTVTAIG
jgi:hypothetical protein